MDNTLIALHNADNNNSIVYVNVSCIAYIIDDETSHLLVGLTSGLKFHMKEKLKDLPPSFIQIAKN